ncbi:MAG: hypothetical protein Q8922_06735 [Bacteroidota bacterium]|nr:hypothetical protein [Bacteroidota bacterium]MDP4232710.1 hypothetical protein [Bacteroidota bacterium]MDP4243157.1 hypothetical protein [Bacteroidota bacterium]MDP4287614.1 hypothetical protein [Bacteroidota bacterium]
MIANPRRMLALTSILLCCFGASASSLPRFALRGGEVDCRGCHVDPTGGRMRTQGGDNFAMNRLPMWERGPKFSANIGDAIRIGVDMRSQYLYFGDHTTADFVIPGHDSVLARHILRDTTVKASGALEMALPIYVSAKLSESIEAFVKVNPIVSPLVSTTWEGYGIIHFVHSSGEFFDAGAIVGDAYFKVGAFYPAFGIRFDDHTVYTRGGNASFSGFGPAGLFWQPNYVDEGIELGAELFDHAFITADFLNGNEAGASLFKNDPLGPYAIALRGVINTGPMMDHTVSAEIGGSLYAHTIQHFPPQPPPGVGDSTARTWLTAIHGGIHVGPVSVLAEFDMGNFIYHVLPPNYPISNPVGQYSDTVHAMAIETAVDITKGLTGILRFDNYYGGNVGGISTNIKTRLMVGAQWFPVRFLEFRPEFRVARGTAPSPADPTKLEDHTETTALIQTHIFF